MTDQHNRAGMAPLPLAAVYGQLDDHVGEAEAPYDIVTGVRRLRRWMAAEGIASSVAATDRTATGSAQQHSSASTVNDTVLVAAGAGSWVLARQGAAAESASAPPHLAVLPPPREASRLGSRGPAGPTVLRILVGTQLRRLREASRITQEAAGQAIRASAPKISRIELGRVAVKERDLASLLSLYGVDDQHDRQALFALSRRANTAGWWHQYTDMLPAWLEVYVGLEQATVLIRTYETQFVPGLLQTENYARAVTRLGNPDAPAAEIDRRAQLRMNRQQVLDTLNSPRLWAVIDEAVLRRPLGNREVMREQLQHLIDAATHPNITIQVLPFPGSRHAITGPFSILRFPKPDLPDVIYIEQLTGALYLDRQEETELYLKAMDQLSVDAEPPAASRQMIHRILDEN
jgi:transcriptional regulator with XRE-family HTH domain